MPFRLFALLRATLIGAGLTALYLAMPASSKAEERFFDDFSEANNAWRLGNAELNQGRGALALGPRRREAVLTGTAVHPKNLSTFAATLRFRFGPKGDPVLIVAWAKPREWDPLPKSGYHCFLRREGRVTFKLGTETIGQVQLPEPKEGVYELRFSQNDQSITATAADGEKTISLPEDAPPAAGYFSLRQQGIGRGTGQQPLRIESVELMHTGQHEPMTPKARHAEIQQWVGDRLDANEEVLAEFQRHIADETDAGRWGFATDMSVSPGLVRRGEKVVVELSSTEPARDQNETAEIILEPNYLAASPEEPRTVQLTWQPAATPRRVARLELEPKVPGNWRVTWQQEGEKLTRTFAVVDDGYAACRFLITNHRGLWQADHAPEAYDVIHQFDLPTEYWAGTSWVSPFARSPEDLLDLFRVFSEMQHRWGDRVFAQCNANWIVPGCHDTNLWRLDAELQRQGIEQLSRLWDMLDVGPMEILGGYTYGHQTPRVARELGVKVLDSLVQWQNWRDGGDDNAWLINQWGAPTVPYYVADDDFRKVAPGKSIVAFTQGTTSNARIYYINFLEGQPQLSYLRRRPAEDMAETANIHRFCTAVDLWLAEAPHQKGPVFLSIGLENFRDSPDWNEANKRGVAYVIRQALQKKIVFVSAVDIADYYHRHYDRQPETWFYWPDVYAGYQAGYKPRRAPDRIEISNASWHTVHEEGDHLPRFIWDYTQPWDEPVWDDQAEIRLKYGLVKPELLTAENCVPQMVDLRGIEAEAACQSNENGATIEIAIRSTRPLAALPVAAWNVPLAAEGLQVADSSDGARPIPVVDGTTENLSLVIVCNDVPAGQSRFTVELQGNPRKPLDPVLTIGDHVGGRVFVRDDGPSAYVWLTDDAPEGVLEVRIPERRAVVAQDNAGRLIEPEGGVLRIPMKRDWEHESPRIVGLTAEELRSGARFEPSR